jgi:hypothetical protein
VPLLRLVLGSMVAAGVLRMPAEDAWGFVDRAETAWVPSTGLGNSTSGKYSAISAADGRLMTVSGLAMTNVSKPG